VISNAGTSKWYLSLLSVFRNVTSQCL